MPSRGSPVASSATLPEIEPGEDNTASTTVFAPPTTATSSAEPKPGLSSHHSEKNAGLPGVKFTL